MLMESECPNCKTENANWLEDVSRGDYICADCGMVLDERIVDCTADSISEA